MSGCRIKRLRMGSAIADVSVQLYAFGTYLAQVTAKRIRKLPVKLG